MCQKAQEPISLLEVDVPFGTVLKKKQISLKRVEYIDSSIAQTGFYGDSITWCQCLDSSLVHGVMDSETPEKKSADKTPSTSKRNAGPGDLDDW